MVEMHVNEFEIASLARQVTIFTCVKNFVFLTLSQLTYFSLSLT